MKAALQCRVRHLVAWHDLPGREGESAYHEDGDVLPAQVRTQVPGMWDMGDEGEEDVNKD